MLPGPLYDLADVWDDLHRIATERNKQKVDYPDTRQLTGNPHLAGVCGEWGYGQMTGLMPNLELLEHGDGRPDFPGVEVKTSKYYTDPWLRLFTDEELIAEIYVLVALNRFIDFGGRWVQPIGYATAAEIDVARGKLPPKDEKEGEERRILSWRDLHHFQS